MSHTYKRTVGKCEVSIVVNSDWSGEAEVVIEDHSMEPYRVDRATCIAKELAIGDLRTVRGGLNTVQWMMAAALASGVYARTRSTEFVSLDERWALYLGLRDGLVAADVCLACGAHTPGRTCHCENDE